MRRGRRLSFAACLVLAVAAAPRGALAQTADELYASAVKARQAQHFDEAADLLKRALALKPDDADALVQLGFAELGRNDLPAARDAFSKALSLAPNYRDATFGMAEVEYRSGNLDVALPLAETVAKADPVNTDAAVLVENIRKAKQTVVSKPKAAAAVLAAVKKPHRRPDPVPGLMEDGRRLRTEGKLPEAEKVYRRALKLSPKNTDVLVALGLVVGSSQRFDEADPLFDRALAIKPGLLDARLGKVRLAIWQGDTLRAQALIDGVLATAPDNVEALDLEGRIALLEADYTRAGRSFQRALALEPRNAEALVGIGDVRRADGDDEAARQAYHQALALQPGSADVEQRLAIPPPRNWRLDLGSEVSDLTNGLGDWTDSSARLAYRLSPRTTISGRTRLATRFGHTDVQLEGRIDQAFTPTFSAYALAAVTPDADFLARYSIGAGASWQVVAPAKAFGPLSLNIDARYDSFADTSVTSIQPWAQAYILDGRLGLSARWVHAEDDTGTVADGYVLRADLAATERFNLFAGYADAPEIDDGALVPTRTVFGGISFEVSDPLTLRASIAHEERPTFDRNIFGLGLTARF
ncbi:YaiO family outer membrane beta-barrel protein [Mesorhizobium sp.]|uniref:YaiO family outer membrane beta-barrel protein n=1 Tax=Mesorhizobium sp. TaxID=1871066 RepID=UPI000FEA998B|nr:YaiO family outer membrane beta-barrel protein [Mesorhizobium sp.]RWB42930.1 MAG: YaiO family outer membrane beta-barrel protein [Mesorhizobium sp.]RWB64934.1 MAG: YaiO family outer membrane beta-barrel protein [Mesorhizobium sp.]RWB88106.1 MAG: YaiO family outer membrane beta-barrel protein [Mesorhizobium sp.]RWC16702.1 MAG: YaiO family outer membrane beta-barrel protein [Mesorhizobium sp.]RWD77356.1 MAG: YaiO family outer membrane beta-barrel protein [Mesorhizobium sp.]